MPQERVLYLHAESEPSAAKYVTLSPQRDRFGDPFAHVHYEWSAFDHETHAFAGALFDKFAAASGATEASLNAPDSYFSGNHHMGTCRMGRGPSESVVDSFGRVHGSPNVFVVGSSTFPGSGAVNPTLTIVALAMRTADHLLQTIL